MRIAKGIHCFSIMAALLFAVAVPSVFSSDSASPTNHSLEQGVRLYRVGKYHDAMDSFMDVLVNGTPSERSIANDYINKINQKTDAEDSGISVDEYTSSKDKSDAEKYAESQSQDQATAQPAQQPAAPATSKASKASVKQTVAAPAAETETPAEDDTPPARPVAKHPSKAQSKPKAVEPEQETQQQSQAEDSAAPEEEAAVAPQQNDAERKAVMARQIEQKIKAMRSSLLASLASTKGIKIFKDGDNPTAINIDPDVIFSDKVTFRPNVDNLLNTLAGLIFVTGTKASFIVTPPGFATGDSQVLDLRRAMALHSFFIQRGVSMAKLSVNLGASADDELASKYRELTGIGLIFDYDREPALKQNLDQDSKPEVTLGVFPASFDPARGQGAIIDFSIVETSAKVESWRVQIFRYGADKELTLVRDTKGDAAAYHQIFWNGRKGFFGDPMPYGKYLCVLSARDSSLRDVVLRRTVTLSADNSAKISSEGFSSVTIGGRKGAAKPEAETDDSSSAASPAGKGAASKTYAMAFRKGYVIFAAGGKESLEKLAAALGADQDAKATITGYANSSEKDAEALAKKRAAAVVYILSSSHSIDKSRLTTAVKVGKKTKPFVVAVLGE
jgi:hypothetical protein